MQSQNWSLKTMLNLHQMQQPVFDKSTITNGPPATQHFPRNSGARYSSDDTFAALTLSSEFCTA